jgi:hypothetical protein
MGNRGSYNRRKIMSRGSYRFAAMLKKTAAHDDGSAAALVRLARVLAAARAS